jgi:putative sterol carrier protein
MRAGLLFALEVSMAIPFPSDAWVKAFEEKLNNSATYAEVAKNWEGDFCFQIEYPDRSPALLYMDLWHGKCRSAYEVTDPASAPKSAFRLIAPLANFAKILKGELDPMQAMLTGKLKVQGNMVMMMKNIPTVLEFVRTAQQVETEFLV